MKLKLENGRTIDSAIYHDISIAVNGDSESASAWYCQAARFTPVMTEHFIGDVNLGGSVNFRDISFNPHGNGTHTECVGHISKEPYSINQCLKEFLVPASLISIEPKKVFNEKYRMEDDVITAFELREKLNFSANPCLIIRSLPNNIEKLKHHYSNTNPPYMEAACVDVLNAHNIHHLMIDLPSVDRELDGGELACHHKFWEYPVNPQLHKTITEFIFVDNEIPDGEYLVNIQIASMENDASPSKILLFPYE